MTTSYFRILLFTLLLSVTSLMSIGQDEGDSLFDPLQVIHVDLQFYDPDFWDLLVDEYEGEQDYILADVTVEDVHGTYFLDSVGVRLKGNSSYNHPGDKKSFKIDFNRFTSDDGQNYHGVKKLNFSNGFKDPSFIREKLYNDLCYDAGIQGPRSNYAEVYMNDEYWGFYTVVEQIDDQFLDRFIGDDDGNLFKAGDNFGMGTSGDEADLAFYGTDQSEYENRYELKTNEDLNDWSDLISLLDFINNTSDEEFASGLSDRIDLIPFLKSIAMDNIFSNLDTYINSARNYYLYHNLSTDQWEWIKWDSNECFGTYGGMGLDLEELDPDYHANDRPLIERIVEIPELYEMYIIEYCNLYQQFLNNDFLDPRIDELFDLIDSYVEADDNKMYTYNQFLTSIEENVFVGGMGGGNVFGLKSFVSNRSEYLDQSLDCTVEILETDPLFGLRIYPNPASDIIFLEIQDYNMISEIVIYNAEGKRCLEINEFTGTIDVSFLPKGLYFLHLNSNGIGICEKIMIN